MAKCGGGCGGSVKVGVGKKKSVGTVKRRGGSSAGGGRTRGSGGMKSAAPKGRCRGC